MSQHYHKLRNGQHSNPHLQSAWLEYGENNFEAFVIEECLKEELIIIEQLYLDNTKCLDRDFGYNINIKADRIILTEEQRKKISLSKIGKPRSVELRKKISEIGKKRKWSVEQREKFIKSNSGENHWNYGGHRTEEEKIKIGKANKVSIKKWWKLRKESDVVFSIPRRQV